MAKDKEEQEKPLLDFDLEDFELDLDTDFPDLDIFAEKEKEE